VILYLDSSSLVKLFIHEEGSEDVRQLMDQARWVSTSVIAYPEACSAFARQLREKALTPEEHRFGIDLGTGEECSPDSILLV